MMDEFLIEAETMRIYCELHPGGYVNPEDVLDLAKGAIALVKERNALQRRIDELEEELKNVRELLNITLSQPPEDK